MRYIVSSTRHPEKYLNFYHVAHRNSCNLGWITHETKTTLSVVNKLFTNFVLPFNKQNTENFRSLIWKMSQTTYWSVFTEIKQQISSKSLNHTRNMLTAMRNAENAKRNHCNVKCDLIMKFNSIRKITL